MANSLGHGHIFQSFAPFWTLILLTILCFSDKVSCYLLTILCSTEHTSSFELSSIMPYWEKTQASK